MDTACATGNTDHFYNKLEAVIRETLSQYFATLKKRKDISPMKLFLKSNGDHPQIEELKTAIENKNGRDIELLINRIGADGWKAFLRSIKKNDTEAFFAYLARIEGRKKSGFTSGDFHPMLDEKGKLVRP